LFNPFTARTSVDLPDPERPISTTISPRATSNVAPMTPTIWPLSRLISAADMPCVDQRNAFDGRGPNTMSTLSNRTAGIAFIVRHSGRSRGKAGRG
jgi:hypothetical protein